jgi:hypothetical protein
MRTNEITAKQDGYSQKGKTQMNQDSLLEMELFKHWYDVTEPARCWLFWAPVARGKEVDAIQTGDPRKFAITNYSPERKTLAGVRSEAFDCGLGFVGAAYQTNAGLLAVMVPRTFDEPERTNIHEKLRKLTDAVLRSERIPHFTVPEENLQS